MEGYFNWYEEGWKSDSWRQQNIVSKEDVQRQAGRTTSTRDDLTDRSNPQDRATFRDRFGISRDNDNMKQIRKLLNAQYQTPSQRGRAVIEVLTEISNENTTPTSPNTIIPTLKKILNNANNNVMNELYSYKQTSSLRLSRIQQILSKKLIPEDITSMMKIQSILKEYGSMFQSTMSTNPVRAQLQTMSYEDLIKGFRFFGNIHVLLNG